MMSIYVEYCGGERRQCVYNFVYKRCNGALKGMIESQTRLCRCWEGARV